MAWEIRVSAVPDFHLYYFVEFQTSVMSTDGINDMSAQVPKKILPKRKNLLYLNGCSR